MAVDALTHISRARSNSGSTLKAHVSNEEIPQGVLASIDNIRGIVQVNLSTHDDTYSRETVLFAESCLSGSGIVDGDLVEIKQANKAIGVRDFEAQPSVEGTFVSKKSAGGDESSPLAPPTFLCLVKTVPSEQASKQHSSELSINKQIALAFSFPSPSRVVISRADKQKWRSSHAEICFRDAYLSRADMWRFTTQELVGKPIYAGQKLSFLNSLKATIRSIHVDGRHARVAYFDSTTVPVFRSEAARYVIFIQMSREMWDFDSDGNGEILFNRVVNGFLPELFKRWSSMEVRHLVSIVMFGRLEYRRSDIIEGQGVLSVGFATQLPFSADKRPIDHQDFYRVVVTDMASAQWTTILEELKRDFRTFLRDVLLFRTPAASSQPTVHEDQEEQPSRITGRLSGALQGNILEAINLAASQFSDDYIDRDLIRTGISTVVITAGSGVFDVDRDLLKLTSETLTNNGIGIDIVCLSRMPLHSVPLFRYKLEVDEDRDTNSINGMRGSSSLTSLSQSLPHASLPNMSASPAFSSTNASLNYFSRFPSAFPTRLPPTYGYGMPQWIDLSYWSSEIEHNDSKWRRRRSKHQRDNFMSDDLFKPRVRMYELQMMGLMEMGMADIAIPYLNEQTLESDASLQKWDSRLSRSHYSQTLSRSPEMRRDAPRSIHTFGDLRSPQVINSSVDTALAGMDEYDKAVFPTTTTGPTQSRRSKHPEKMQDCSDTSIIRLKKTNTSETASRSAQASTRGTSMVSEASKPGSNASDISKSSRPARAPRMLSYGAKGLMPLRATAVTAQVQVENINAQSTAPATADESSDASGPKLTSRPDILSRASMLNLGSKRDGSSRPGTPNKGDEGSRPIKIDAHVSTASTKDSSTKLPWRHRQRRRTRSERIDNSEQISDSDDKLSDISATHESTPSSVPESQIPFIRNVNASNPLKRRSHGAVFGRWQHLYPRRPRAATVKWRSLCTPASVPLTTADFPSREELERNYEALSHVVRSQTSDDAMESTENNMRSLFIELLSLRISHGYQFVVGDNVSAAFEEDLSNCHGICQPSADGQSRLVAVLSMGNTIQKLDLYKGSSVRVTKYVQKQDLKSMSFNSTFQYDPYIRTILSDNYFSRHLTFQGFSEQYPWDLADNHLAGHGQDDKQGTAVEQLRYWRARFVLLPVEPPASTWKKHQQDENEEEIHILGIRALTQLWQKNRYVTASDRELMQTRMGNSKNRDENPLEVKMETLNPSQMVALELDRLAQFEDGGESESTQLLPEPQKLDRETSMSKIAQMMQSNQGIEIKHRRWHWRLYHNCFHGEGFTNWLMHNVKNMNTREDAVEFGNQLMKEGLFEHVNGRHEFKDGTYFYSIKQQYRQFRPDLTRSWFSTIKSDKSVPPTPLAEQPPKELSPLTVRTRSGSNIAQQLNAATTPESKPFSDKRRKAVSLSRMIRVDVDTRKKSLLGRPEMVHVHYDRFYNPENCYHIGLNWFNTTCKLVDDAIVSWTNVAEKYGLKLVEVPIAEACDVPIAEPFRSPLTIKLALEPPKQKANNVLFNPIFYSTTTFTPHPPANSSSIEKHVYQKAILKRFNFVLDLEAANEFPEGVDIQYSWGQFQYKHTQFIHRSGVLLAQIVDNGDIIVLANRLYNSRLANTKENRMFDPKGNSGPHHHRPAIPPTAAASMQASGIVGINLASPNAAGTSSPGLRPVPNMGALASPNPSARPPTPSRAPTSNQISDAGKTIIADTFGPKSTFIATGLWNTLITPEQIKDDLEAFCQDKARLEAFYKEVANAPMPQTGGHGNGSRKATGSSSSSMLRPVKEAPGTFPSDITAIPAFELPEAVTAVRELRRATVAYEHVSEMFDRSRMSSRHGSAGSGEHEEGGRVGNGILGTASPLRKATK